MKVSLYVDNGNSFPIEKYLQKNPPKEVELLDVFNAFIDDAVLAPRTVMERFGVSTEIGVINLIDTWTFEGYKDGRLPRYYLANANWRYEPSLLIAVRERITQLVEIISSQNKSHSGTINTFLLDGRILGGWHEYPDEQDEALDLLIDGLYKLIKLD